MTQFLLNCSNFTEHQFWRLALARGLSGASCLLLCSLALSFILLHRAYKTVLQRLFLYQSSTTFVYLITIALQIERVFTYQGQQNFCVILGFLVQCTGSTVVLFTFDITIFLFFKVLAQSKGDVSPVIRSRRGRVGVEVCVVAVAIFLPLSVDWVVFVRGNYGLAGGWCWIKTINSDCSVAGFLDQLMLFYFPLAVLIVLILVAMVAMVVMFCVSAYMYRETRHQHHRRVKETILLLVFLLAFAVLSGFEVTARLYTGFSHKHQHYVLWMVYAIGCPLGKLVLPVGFLVYLYSLKKFTWTAITAAVIVWREQCFHCCHPQPTPMREEEAGDREQRDCEPLARMT